MCESRLGYQVSLCWLVDCHSRLDTIFTLKCDHQMAGNHDLWLSLTHFNTDMDLDFTQRTEIPCQISDFTHFVSQSMTILNFRNGTLSSWKQLWLRRVEIWGLWNILKNLGGRAHIFWRFTEGSWKHFKILLSRIFSCIWEEPTKTFHAFEGGGTNSFYHHGIFQLPFPPIIVHNSLIQFTMQHWKWGGYVSLLDARIMTVSWLQQII